MDLIIKPLNINLGAALKNYTEKKFKMLEKLIPNDGKNYSILVEISRTTKHHRKSNDLYEVRCSIEIFGKSIRIEQRSEDPGKAVDLAKDRLKRILSERKK